LPARLLAYYRLSLKEAAGGSPVLQSAAGQTALVPHLGALWPAAERLVKRRVDPLDPDLVAALIERGTKPRV
jgi:hypothetical protein